MGRRHAFLSDAPDHSRQAGRYGGRIAWAAVDQYRLQPALGLDPHRGLIQAFHLVSPATRSKGFDALYRRRQVAADAQANADGRREAVGWYGQGHFPCGVQLAVRSDRAVARQTGLEQPVCLQPA
ncbi:hypothetical protein D3C85_1440340 [compost metagenome]